MGNGKSFGTLGDGAPELLDDRFVQREPATHAAFGKTDEFSVGVSSRLVAERRSMHGLSKELKQAFGAFCEVYDLSERSGVGGDLFSSRVYLKLPVGSNIPAIADVATKISDMMCQPMAPSCV